jgi:UDP-galactopyranose mutase
LPRLQLDLYGVINERLDIVLIDAAAAMRPEWRLAMIGEVVRIDAAVLPVRSNTHWLVPKPPEQPFQLAGWPAAWLVQADPWRGQMSWHLTYAPRREPMRCAV